MNLHQVRKDLLINLDRVLRVEIEAIGLGRFYQVRFTMQGNCTHVQDHEFKTREDAVSWVMGLSDAGCGEWCKE